jgi:hypothetical protein
MRKFLTGPRLILLGLAARRLGRLQSLAHRTLAQSLRVA